MQRVTAYLAASGFVEHLVYELGDVDEVHERLVLAKGPPRPAAWAANIWLETERLHVDSIGAAAKELKSRARNWASYTTAHHRRAALIKEQLPPFNPKPLEFPQPAPTAPLGSFTLLDRDTLLFSPRCTSPFVNGAAPFIEDKTRPPNRAYLKLWESLTLLGRYPKAGERCLDLGASPGGWTWVAARLGAHVLAIDRSPLAPKIARLPTVEFKSGNAFAFAPDSSIDWLLCDVAAYPVKLWQYVEKWLERDTRPQFICTVKCQGEPDWKTLARFAAVPGSRLLHLHHNKHELTWVYPAAGALAFPADLPVG
jgi:23S rRNA (cytidine2498-2'-O)-methyltransferase